MSESELFKLIKSIEYGTNLHIHVAFLKNEGNPKTYLPLDYNYHSREICEYFKSIDNNTTCFRCRSTVLEYVSRRQKPLCGICVNGIYEYCQPVIKDGRTVCVIFVGHIMPPEGMRERINRKLKDKDLLNGLEQDFSEEKCRSAAEVIGSYIEYLIKSYVPKQNDSYNPLIENLKSYIEENLGYDFNVVDIAKRLNYNEKYLGKLFKQNTGNTIKEYVNLRRVEVACELLKNTYIAITDISSKAGFNNVTYFNRVFKSIKGVSPTDFRKSL